MKNKTQFERKLKSYASRKSNDYGNLYNQNGIKFIGSNDLYYNFEFDQNNNVEIFAEEMNVILSLWEDLGVTDYYKIIFDSLARDLDTNMKKYLLDNEMSSLKKFSDSLLVIK